MGANTNGFNYSSDYQGHSGSLIIILVFLFFSIIVFGSSIKKDVPDSSYNNDYNDSYDNNYNDSYSDYYDNNESINNSVLDENINTNDNVLDNNEVHDDDSMIDHGYFEIYKP